MKKYLFVISLFTILFSCNNNSNDNIENLQDITQIDSSKIKIENPLKGLREFSLKDYELDITIMIPEKYYTDEDDLPRFIQPIIIHNDGEAKWEVKIPGDKYWHLIVEDMTGEKTSVVKEKEQHSYTDIFDYVYHIENDTQLLYSKILKSENSTLDSKEIEKLPNYHFFCNRLINSYNIVFRSFQMKNFRRLTVNKMLISANNSF
jgi:hypothetical protein